MTRKSWALWALDLASVVATRSEDPYLQVGAVVLRPDNSVASVGYNGAPPGVELDWSDRDERRPYVIHAEVNALRYVRKDEVAGGLLATTHIPCLQCLPVIASYGLDVVQYRELLGDAHDLVHINHVANKCGITLIRRQYS